MRTIILSFLSLLFPIVATAADRTCYLPNGVEQPGDTPCNGIASQSHCCGEGDYCLDNGLCYDKTFTLSVSSCTDSSWNDPACFQQCKQAQSPVPITPTGLFISVAQSIRTFCCDIHNFNVTGNNTCDYDDVSRSPFRVEYGSVITDRETGSVEIFNTTHSQPANATNASSTATVTITSAAENDMSWTVSKNTVIGIGVGLGAGLGVALLAVSALLWREKRKRKAVGEAVMPKAEILYSKPGQGWAPEYSSTASLQGNRYFLRQGGNGVVMQRYEVDGGSVHHEMDGGKWGGE